MIPVIETERLILRAPKEEDVPHEAAFYASDRAEYVGGQLAPELVWRAVAAAIGHWHLRGYGPWAVEEKTTGAYCGHVGPWFPAGWPEPEISYTLMAGAEGRGIGREAAARSLAFAYGELGWTTAISLIDPRNARSIALAERLGARRVDDYAHPQYGAMGIWRYPGPEALQ